MDSDPVASGRPWACCSDRILLEPKEGLGGSGERRDIPLICWPLQVIGRAGSQEQGTPALWTFSRGKVVGDGHAPSGFLRGVDA